MKGLKKHSLDFEIIETGNPYTIVFADASDYYTEPEKPLLEVTFPGSNKYFLVPVAVGKVNTFNSNTLGLSEFTVGGVLSELPDGAYHFRFKICPYDKLYKHKVYFRTTDIKRKLSAIYKQIDATDCSKLQDGSILHSLAEISVLIDGAKIIVCDDQKKANAFYQLALSLINDLDKELSKNC